MLHPHPLSYRLPPVLITGHGVFDLDTQSRGKAVLTKIAWCLEVANISNARRSLAASVLVRWGRNPGFFVSSLECVSSAKTFCALDVLLLILSHVLKCVMLSSWQAVFVMF